MDITAAQSHCRVQCECVFMHISKTGSNPSSIVQNYLEQILGF